MGSKRCVIAGSFDPITRGHADLIRQAAAIFSRVYVGVLNNAAKRCMFSEKQRLDMVSAACAPMGRDVSVLRWDGLLVDLLSRLDADTIVRGIRDARDIEYERQIAAVNARLRPGTQTVWFPASEDNWAVSSTIVRELLTFGADVAAFVPKEILPYLAVAHPDKQTGRPGT